MHRVACVADGFLGEDLWTGKLGRENCTRVEKRVSHAHPFLQNNNSFTQILPENLEILT